MPDLLEEAKRLSEVASEGPWRQGNDAPMSSFGVWSGPMVLVCSTDGASHDTPQAQANAAFIARSRTLIPELVERVEKLRVLARAARNAAAAPDYDEEAIRAALWAVVDEALAAHQRGVEGG